MVWHLFLKLSKPYYSQILFTEGRSLFWPPTLGSYIFIAVIHRQIFQFVEKMIFFFNYHLFSKKCIKKITCIGLKINYTELVQSFLYRWTPNPGNSYTWSCRYIYCTAQLVQVFKRYTKLYCYFSFLLEGDNDFLWFINTYWFHWHQRR